MGVDVAVSVGGMGVGIGEGVIVGVSDGVLVRVGDGVSVVVRVGMIVGVWGIRVGLPLQPVIKIMNTDTIKNLARYDFITRLHAT